MENGAPEIEVEAEGEAQKLEGGETPSKAEVVTNTAQWEAVGGKSRVQLPDVPTGDPDDEGPATKKHKSDV